MSDKYSPEVMNLYRLYGAAFHTLGTDNVRVKSLSRSLGVSEWSVRQLRKAVAELGPPDAASPTLGSDILVVPDSHAAPGQDLRRFTWLGRAIEHYGRRAMDKGVPFRVVWIGDTGDYHSLSHYDKGTGKAWNSTYALDVAAHREAMRLTREAVSDAVWAYADKHWTEGNHEHRAVRYMNDNPELQGVLKGPWDVMQEFDVQCHAYTDIVQLDGVGFCHVMQNPGTGRPVGGINQARSMVLKGFRSMVVGHSHRLGSYTQNDLYGNPIKCMVVGCYFEHKEEYAGQGNNSWWRGLVVLENVHGGTFDETPVRMETVHARFGGSRAP
jgi:hypothetical protein